MADLVLGVGGGIAAYKAVSLLRLLTESGHQVTVVPTRSALEFVGAPTWAALSGRRANAEVWDDASHVPHVSLGRQADLVVVAPTTANLLSRAAHGVADDLLTSVLLTAGCPVVLAPAMHTEMWEHPATVANVATLRARGVLVVEPAEGRLTGADTGKGRLPDPEELARLCDRVLARGTAAVRDLTGRRVVVSAGGTREPVDPVRFLGNRSTGRQGYALAVTAVARGAEVVLVSANVELPDPAGAEVVRVGTAAELRDTVHAAAVDADVVVMAAAVADFRPVAPSPSKRKKGAAPPPIELETTTDVLAELVGRRREGQLLVGFAAETGDADAGWLDHGRAKLATKGCDLLVVNEVGAGLGFGSEVNAAVLLGDDGSERAVPTGPKSDLADVIWDEVVSRLPPGAAVRSLG
jgi:phosphopantothenoylcysteine decarboxylase/phosphopantothenate--cysteine ligase